MAQLTQAFPDKSFSGIGGIAEFPHALNYFLLGCGTVQVCTAAMLDHAIGPNVIKRLTAGMQAAMERHGWKSLEDFRGIRRDRVVAHSKIRRPDAKAYRGGYDAEGYAAGRPSPSSGRDERPTMTPGRGPRRSSSSPRTSRTARSGTPTSRRRPLRAAPGPPTTSPRSGSA